MCGRHVLHASEEQLALRFEFSESRLPADLPPRYNVAPTDLMPVVALSDGVRKARLARFGLVPSWAKDAKPKASMINARAEMLGERAAYRDLLESHRCLVPANGFYEWRRDAGGKTPLYIHPSDGELFAFAGLWSAWQDPATGEWLRSFTIITSEPNALVRPIHHRMPVILPREAEAAWLGETGAPWETLQALLRPGPNGALVADVVSLLVNSVRNDSPACIERVG